jgi:hypothetical protein
VTRLHRWIRLLAASVVFAGGFIFANATPAAAFDPGPCNASEECVALHAIEDECDHLDEPGHNYCPNLIWCLAHDEPEYHLEWAFYCYDNLEEECPSPGQLCPA